MKRFLRSGAAKTAAFLLILACAAAFAAVTIDMLDLKGSPSAYRIGDPSFEESHALWKAKSELMAPMYLSSPTEAFDAVTKYGHGRFIGKGDDWNEGFTDEEIEKIKALPYWFHWTKTVDETVDESEPAADAPPTQAGFVTGFVQDGAELNEALPEQSSAHETSDAPETPETPETPVPSADGPILSMPDDTNTVTTQPTDPVDTAYGGSTVLQDDGSSGMKMWAANGAGGRSTQFLTDDRLITETGNIEFNVTPSEFCNVSFSVHSDRFDPISSYCIMVRLSSDGYIKVGNAGQLDTVASYEPGKTYFFHLAVDALDSVYYAYMTDEEGLTKSLGEDEGFNMTVPAEAGLTRLTITFDGGVSFNNILINRGPLMLLNTDRISDDSEPQTHAVLDDGTVIYTAGKYEGATFTFQASGYSDSDNQWHEIANGWSGNCDVYVGMTNEYYQELVSNWLKSRDAVISRVYILSGLVLLALLLFIFLLAEAGRKSGDDELHTLVIDRLPVEITAVIGLGAAALLAFGSVAAAWSAAVLGEVFFMTPLSALAATAASALFVITAQSLVRGLKAGLFLEHSLIYRLAKKLWALAKKTGGLLLGKAKKGLSLLGRLLPRLKKAFAFLCGNRLTVSVMALFLIYTFLVFIAGLGEIPILLLIVPIAGYVLCRYLIELDKIKTGIFKIRNGDEGHKVGPCRTELLNNCAEALNTINDGFKLSVEREVKAQRMKSELITNVSHDLKTPLTSIISYADLLCGMELAPKEANDYAAIIKQKGDKLKKLTTDLFDISKAESGNETVKAERLDIALLLRQSLAELGNEIENSSLSFVTDIPDAEIFVSADGKKLSRVFENLLINAVKYSMAGTRVYVSLKCRDEDACVEFKNISAAPMNFDPSEITERFVRGDQSRSTEGSGLGLAIARSYAELCGGGLKIEVDGDLFKATVKIKLL